MKILQIAPQFPYPLDSGGKIGIYNIVKQLSRFGAEIFFVAFSRVNIPNEYLEYFSKFCHPFVIYENTANTLPKIVKYFLLNKPIFTEKYFTKTSRNFFARLIKEIDFDIIHLDHTAMYSIGRWVAEKTNKPVGLRLHNIEWLIWKRYLDEQKPFSPKKLFLLQQTKLLRQKEIEAIRFAKVSFTCTKQDRQLALELVPEANVLVASPGVDLEFWQIDENVERNTYEIVFATTYDWLPNVEGLRWYLDFVHPRVLQQEPNVFLTILGKNPPEFCCKYRNVNVVGYVERVQPYYNRAGLFIVPLFVASGVRMRIYEAMAMGLPVVSTSIGAEGIEASETEGLFIADTPEDFAQKILNLVRNPQNIKIIGKQARKFIETNYSVNETIKIIYEEYIGLIK